MSLLMRMIQEPFFQRKKILVIDQSAKTNNDRTWCFWETGPGLFEAIIYHRWQQLNFYSPEFSSPVNIAPYQYKMIRGIDFYSHVLQQARQHPNVHFLYRKIQSIGNENGLGYVLTSEEKMYSDYIFNSLPPSSTGMAIGQGHSPALESPVPGWTKNGGSSLLQHFKGWLIETPENLFNDAEATFMDFRVSQQQATIFVYVLPIAPNKALVEYTLVSETLLSPEEYDQGLKKYIGDYVSKGSYTILEEEFGVIPMTDYQFPHGDGQIINIGTAGGQTKASSGFTFQFIQKQAAAIVNELVKGQSPLIKPPFLQKRFHLYDSILLHVLQTGKMPGSSIFARMFKHIPPKTILRFLDNESTLIEELRIMAAMPPGIFLPTAIKIITK